LTAETNREQQSYCDTHLIVTHRDTQEVQGEAKNGPLGKKYRVMQKNVLYSCT